mmetsp:Transcript_173311/g.550182  ORF Transcript_173311/g.550182 Transcript_173311/m.550182 type:complete len:126 (+) Transcript_173311:213-590(+)
MLRAVFAMWLLVSIHNTITYYAAMSACLQQSTWAVLTRRHPISEENIRKFCAAVTSCLQRTSLTVVGWLTKDGLLKMAWALLALCLLACIQNTITYKAAVPSCLQKLALAVRVPRPPIYNQNIVE